MKILIDGLWYGKPRGLGKYIRELVAALNFCADQGVQIFIALPKDSADGDYAFPDGVITPVWGPSLPYPVWEQFYIPWLCNRLDADVLHSPCNTYPLLLKNRRLVVTIHDLIFLRQGGESFYQRAGNVYRSWIARSLNKYPNAEVVTVSATSGREIERLLGKESNVVYTAVTIPAVFKEEAPAKRSRPYLIHIGGTAPHKNTAKVIEAYRKSNLLLDLIILGLPHDCDLAKSNESDSIFFPGWVSDSEVFGLISNSEFLIFPSSNEGFGLPIVEAFLAGTPVITSDVDPMKEIAADAALLINPDSTDAIRDAMILMAKNPDLRADLLSRGSHRVKVFSQSSFASAMYRLYRGDGK